jgi:hypothetical protein
MIDEKESNEALQGILQDLNYLKERDIEQLIEVVSEKRFLSKWKIDMITKILRYDEDN